MTQPHQTRKYLQSSGYVAKFFQTRLLQLQVMLKDSSLTLIWFCCVLFLIVFMNIPSEHSNNVIYCIRWLSNAFFSPVFLKIFLGDGGMPPYPSSIASRLRHSHLGHWPSNCIGRYWQTLADIFQTYLPIGRFFSFSKCNPENTSVCAYLI